MIPPEKERIKEELQAREQQLRYAEQKPPEADTKKQTTSKIVGWFLLVYGGFSLVTGLLLNDMGGLASMGYNPDVAMSFGRAPLRFLIGIALNSAFIFYGWKLVNGEKTL